MSTEPSGGGAAETPPAQADTGRTAPEPDEPRPTAPEPDEPRPTAPEPVEADSTATGGPGDGAKANPATAENPESAAGAESTAEAESGNEPERPGEAESGGAADRTADENPESGAGAEGSGEAEGGGERQGAGGAQGGGAGPAADENPEGGVLAEGSGGAEGGGGAAQLSEAQGELLAQKVERERIERRKAEKAGRVDSGAGLSGRAADLLAAVRAVESGAKPPAAVFAEPAPVHPVPAPDPVHRPQPTAPGPVAAPPAPAPDTVAAVRRVLADGGAPETLVAQTAAALGEDAGELLRADPWRLLRVPGVRPEQADGFARALLGPDHAPDDERRGRAVTVWLLEQAALAGHTALELPALTSALARQSVPDADAVVQDALAEGEALAFQDAAEQARGQEDEEDPPVRVLVGLERYALAEESLADALARIVNSVPKDSAAAWETAATGSAAELVGAVAGHGLVLHSGGEAARAESAALLATARSLGLRAFAACHTPDGRRRFAERAQAPDAVVTVHGLLACAEGPGRDGEGAFALDLLILPDAPQLDVESAATLAESLPDGARLMLGGDPAELWSAGPGRVFADLLTARVCPQIVSRTPDPGPLGELVSGIGVGELGQVEAPGKEIVIVPVRDAGEAVHRTVQLVADSVPRAFGIEPDRTVVITPGHGGAAGTRALNAALKERLNPGPGRFGGFDPGDLVAHTPEPGRTVPGRVVGADAEGLRLSCAGAPVVVPRERVERCVRHGWALTAHQAAGSRWPAAVVVLPGDAAQALSRPWVYTAFGRAERHLSVVHGVEQALPQAVSEVPAKPRTTRLPALLRAQVPTAR